MDIYVMALSDMEERARKCYVEHINFSKGEFVKMMLLDGIFVIELFRKWNAHSSYKDDPLLQFWRIQGQLSCDLLLLENQLPFFILYKLFNMMRDPNTQEDITYLALSFLHNVVPGPDIPKVSDIPLDDVKHLLHLVHGSVCILFAAKVPSYNRMSKIEIKKFKFINTVTELLEAGIFFKVVKESNSLFDITFENGLMKISQFFIHERTKSILRSLITYEQLLPDIHGTYVSDYALFMNCIVNSPDDAKFLRWLGIVENSLGDDIMVCNVLNKLTYSVSIKANFSYVQVFKNVNKHYRSSRYKWMAYLRCKYFYNPWALISLLTAVALLLFTVAQTTFSVLSYF